MSGDETPPESGGIAGLARHKLRIPNTVDEAVKLLASHGEKARPLSGGTDLIIQLRAGVRRPEYIVDVKQYSGACGASHSICSTDCVSARRSRASRFTRMPTCGGTIRA